MKIKEITKAIVPADPSEMRHRQEEQDESDGLFEMANLYPRETGLPMTVWVSSRGSARHDVRVKVSMAHGDRMNIANTAVVGVRPTPRVVAGRLVPADAQVVFEWIALNADPLIAYWEGRIGTIELATALRPILSTAAPGGTQP